MQMYILGHGSEWSVYRVSDWPEMAHFEVGCCLQLQRCLAAGCGFLLVLSLSTS